MALAGAFTKNPSLAACRWMRLELLADKAALTGPQGSRRHPCPSSVDTYLFHLFLSHTSCLLVSGGVGQGGGKQVHSSGTCFLSPVAIVLALAQGLDVNSCWW